MQIIKQNKSILIIILISTLSCKSQKIDNNELNNLIFSKNDNREYKKIKVSEIKHTYFYKLLNQKKSKSYKSFKTFLKHYKIKINLDCEKQNFIKQLNTTFVFKSRKINTSKSKEGSLKEKVIFVARPVFSEDKRYAIVYKRINDHIYLLEIYGKLHEKWKKLQTYSSSKIIIDGREVELF